MCGNAKKAQIMIAEKLDCKIFPFLLRDAMSLLAQDLSRRRNRLCTDRWESWVLLCLSGSQDLDLKFQNFPQDIL